jgi:hypothetical protein
MVVSNNQDGIDSIRLALVQTEEQVGRMQGNATAAIMLRCRVSGKLGKSEGTH